VIRELAPNPLAALAKLEDNRAMTDLSFSLPDDLAGRLKSRLADGRYANAGEYLRELVRRDLEEAADTAWVRARIEEGEASGFVDRDAREVLKEIVAERHARHG
jgi:antitoxin ParD1/3/4